MTHDDVIFTDLGGGEGVLVDLNSKQYFQLNETACLIWQALSKGTPEGDIAHEMTEIYDVTPERAQASVERAIQAFAAHRLLSSQR